MVKTGLPWLARARAGRSWTLFKWALMFACVFWTLVFRLSQEAGRLPEFVYANF